MNGILWSMEVERVDINWIVDFVVAAVEISENLYYKILRCIVKVHTLAHSMSVPPVITRSSTIMM